MLIIFGISIFQIYNKTASTATLNNLKNDNIVQISANNYTNVLKSVHENINDYMLNDGGCVEYIPFTYKNKSKP